MGRTRTSKSLPSREPEEDASLPVVFEFVAYVTGSQERLEAMHARASELIEVLYAEAKSSGIGVIRAYGCMRSLRQEEALAVIPRKAHYALVEGGKQVCSTAYVSAKNITTKPSLVTCKLCLIRLEELHG